MADTVKTILVHPRRGVSIFLPGGVHPFTSGPVPMRADHAKELAAHVMTEDEKRADDDERAARALTDRAAAEKAEAQHEI